MTSAPSDQLESEEASSKWLLRVIIYVGMPIASFFALSSAGELAIERFDTRTWQAADAVITDVEVQTIARRTYSTWFRYHFEAYGREWSGETDRLNPNTIGFWERVWFDLNRREGQNVTVHYDPRDPRLHTIHRPSYLDIGIRLAAGVSLGLIPLVNLLSRPALIEKWALSTKRSDDRSMRRRATSKRGN